jgi:hypothetical protein
VQVIKDLDDEAAAVSHVRELQSEQVQNDFALGGVLLRLKKERWYLGYDSFQELCLHEFGFGKSKAYQLISFHKVLRDLHVRSEMVKTLSPSILALLCATATANDFDLNEFSTWVETAKDLTVKELKSKLKERFGAKVAEPKNLMPEPLADRRDAIATAKAIPARSHDDEALANPAVEVSAKSSTSGVVQSPTLAEPTGSSKFADAGSCIAYVGGDQPELLNLDFVKAELEFKTEKPIIALLLITPGASRQDVLRAVQKFMTAVLNDAIFSDVTREGASDLS